MRKQGIVKWFNFKKGFGFIKQEHTEKDIFIHVSALKESGISKLVEGEKVEYEIVSVNNRDSAVKLKKI